VDGQVELALGPQNGALVDVEYRWAEALLAVSKIDAGFDLGRINFAQLAGPVARALAPLAPQGRLTARGTARADLDAEDPLAAAVYDLSLAGAGLSAVNPKTGERSPVRNAEITARRAQPNEPHQLAAVSRDERAGDLDARVSYAPGGALDVDATLRQFQLTRELSAVVGATFGECGPAGLLNGGVRASLRKDAHGRLLPQQMDGRISGSYLSSDCPADQLKFSGGRLEAVFQQDRIVIETFEGRLADGPLTSHAVILAPDPANPQSQWRIEGQALAKDMDLKQFQAVADRPPNELNGKLTIDLMGTAEKPFGFAGPLGDMNQWTANGSAHFGDGHLWQLPMFRALRSNIFKGVAAALQNRFDPTSFRHADTTFTLAGGKVNFPDATIDSQMLRVLITGDVYLAG
jgi:hypothetical protein